MTDQLPANERRARIGGLLRCSLATLGESTEPTQVGSVIACQWCDQTMIVAEDGVWEWNHP